jgi:hypothetical protein
MTSAELKERHSGGEGQSNMCRVKQGCRRCDEDRDNANQKETNESVKSVIVPKRTDRSHVREALLEHHVLMHLVPELAAQEGLTAKEDKHELDRVVRLSDVYDHGLQLW